MEKQYASLREILRTTDVFEPIWNDLYTPEEIQALERFGLERFSAADAAALWGCSEEETVKRLEAGYRKGSFNKYPEEAQYAAVELYYYLDCFVMGDEARWRGYPQELVNAIDAWYFGEYAKRVDQRMHSEEKPSEIVLPLEQALEYIDVLPYDLYVLPCDCSTILRSYEKPKEVCLQSVVPAVNSLVDRGFGRKVTREEAKEIVRQCDKEGLIHSPTNYHFCNCGPHYCYPFRCEAQRGCRREWPKSYYVAKVDPAKCIGCRLCAKRCPVDAINIQEKKAVVDGQVCVGCGVCRVPCPKGAIDMENVIPWTGGLL